MPLLKRSRDRHPFVKLAFANNAYNSSRVAMATSTGIEIVRNLPARPALSSIPAAGCSSEFAWLNRNRRLAKGFAQTIRYATAFLYAASAMLLIRRLARDA